MNLPGLVFALLLPGLLGAGAVLCVAGWPRRRADWAGVLGDGTVLGWLLLAVLLWALPMLPPARAFAWLAVPLLGLSLLLWAAAWRRRAPVEAMSPARLPETDGRALRWILLGLLALQGLLALHQAWTLPTLAWDAWTVWLYKARAWFDAPAFLPFVAPEVWLDDPRPDRIGAHAAHYPDALPRMLVWTAGGAGAWSDAAAHMLWPLLWLALGASLYGTLRAVSVDRLAALVAVAAVLTLPMVNAHVALAGYADLWIAATLASACGRLLRARSGGGVGQAALALAFALLLPTLKLEGAIWLVLFAVAAGLAQLSVRRRWQVVLGVVAVWLVAQPLGGLPLPAPGVGWVRIGWSAIEVPGIGRLALEWRHVGGEILETLYLLPNWHLLWWVLPPLLLWRRAVLLRDPLLAPLRWLLLAGYAFLVLLFGFTDAAQWAENLTSVNRLLLQIVPVTVLFAAAGFRPVDAPPRAQPATSSR